jgi:hypothetical protein
MSPPQSIWPARIVTLVHMPSTSFESWLDATAVERINQIANDAAKNHYNLLDEPVVLDAYGSVKQIGLFELGQDGIDKCRTLLLQITQEYGPETGPLVRFTVQSYPLPMSDEIPPVYLYPGSVGRRLDDIAKRVKDALGLFIEQPHNEH